MTDKPAYLALLTIRSHVPGFRTQYIGCCYYSVCTTLLHNHNGEVVDKIVDKMLNPLNDVWRIIKEKEGKLAICSLIPNHRILKKYLQTHPNGSL